MLSSRPVAFSHGPFEILLHLQHFIIKEFLKATNFLYQKKIKKNLVKEMLQTFYALIAWRDYLLMIAMQQTFDSGQMMKIALHL